MLNDLRHAVRLLLRQPGFTAVASLTLALGIGATAAVFSVVDAALFRPLPYREPDQLVHISRRAKTPDGHEILVLAEGTQARFVREVTSVFDSVDVFSGPRPMALASGTDQSPRVGGFTATLPSFLGVAPQIGRVFTAQDALAKETIIVSDAYWQRAYQRDAGVIGRTIAFSDRSYVVVGVMPPTFRYFVGGTADAWLPIEERDGGDMVARLRPGLTVAQAQRDLDAVLALHPTAQGPRRYEVGSTSFYRSDAASRTMLFSLLAAVACVLLIACANVSNLVLARTLGRQREIAVRGSLGATRWQLVRQFVVEGIVLASLGAVAASLLAWWGIRAIPVVVPAKLLPSLLGVSLPQLDVRVLAFGSAAALICGLICGIVPAMRVSGRSVGDGLLAGAQRLAGGSRSQRRLRELFLTLQVALTLILLVGAWLLTSSLVRMLNTPAGFDPAHLAYVSMRAPAEMKLEQKMTVAGEVADRLAVMPGVQVAQGMPPVAGATGDIELAPADDLGRAAVVPNMVFWVGADYFRVAGIPLREGRAFNGDDRPSSPKAAIISDTAARRFWPGRSAIGQRLLRGSRVKDEYVVVGVVPHLKTIDMVKDGVELFFSIAQTPAWEQGGSTLLVRSTGDVGPVAASIRELIRAVDPRVTVRRIGLVESLFAEFDPYGGPRFYSLMLGFLAALGLATAAVGLYGSLSFSVGQRTREIGVRMALGAGHESVRRLMFGDAAKPVFAGIVAGLLGAMWLSKFVGSQLFHIAPRDPGTFAVVVMILLIVCAIAVMVPARRAARIDPSAALRTE